MASGRGMWAAAVGTGVQVKLIELHVLQACGLEQRTGLDDRAVQYATELAIEWCMLRMACRAWHAANN